MQADRERAFVGGWGPLRNGQEPDTVREREDGVGEVDLALAPPRLQSGHCVECKLVQVQADVLQSGEGYSEFRHPAIG